MNGQGRPRFSRIANRQWNAFIAIFILTLLTQHSIAHESVDGMRVRLSFGGGSDQLWKGQIDFPEKCFPKNLRILGMHADHSGKIFIRDNTLVFDLAKPTQYAGVEFDIDCDSKKPFQYVFKTSHPDVPEVTSPILDGKFTIEELVSGNHSKAFPDSTNRIFVERAPGDDLKFIFDRKSLVFDPESGFEFAVAVSRFCTANLAKEKNLEIRLSPALQPKKNIWKTSRKVTHENLKHSFRLETPDRPGVYDLVIDLVEPSKIPFAVSSKIRSRTIQFVVVDHYPALPVVDSAENLELVYENIPGKPERTTRSRFKSWEKLNSSARDLIFKHIPIPSSSRGIKDFEVTSGSLQLFPLAINQKQLHLKVEIEYEVKNGLTCDFVLFDRRSKNYPYTELVSATVKTDRMARPEQLENSTRTLTLTTWNHSLTPVLMARNLESQKPLRIKKIRVFEIQEGSYEFNLSTDETRRILTQFSPKEFSRLFAAPKAVETNQFSLDDWSTFQSGGQRLVKLIKASNYKGAIIDINEDGSAIYPSKRLQFTPVADTGTFARSGRDPVRKDVLELLFRQFNANALTLVARIELPEYIAKIEAADPEFLRDTRLRTIDGMESATYNYLNPDVQQLISGIVLEVVTRYSHHQSFGGVSLKLGANRQLFIGKNNGYNEKLVDEFLNQKTIKLASTKTFADKRNFVHASHASEFKEWRAEKTTEFLVQLNNELKTISKKSMLLDLSGLVGRDPDQNGIFPNLNSQEDKSNYFHELGFELDELGAAGIGMLLPSFAVSSLDFSSRRTEFALRQGRVGLGEIKKGSGFSRQVIPRVEETGENGQQAGFEKLTYQTVTPNSNRSFRRDLVSQIAKTDSLLAVDAFELGHRSMTSESKRIWKSFVRLPSVVFDDVTKKNTDSPVVVRKKVVGDQGFFYVVNQSPWTIRVSMNFTTPLDNPRTLNGRFFKSLTTDENGAVMELHLKPFDLIAGVSDQKEIEISDVKFSFPDDLKEKLEKKKDQLLAQIRFVKAPQSIALGTNPGFEFDDDQKNVRNWEYPRNEFLKIEPVKLQAPEGDRVLSITNLHESHWGWLRSQYLPSIGTGRLSVLVSMKVKDEQFAPNVRLSVDGNASGREYYRFGSFSTDQSLAESARLEKDWKVFAVHFNDVPTHITNLRVGLDIDGKGTVYVDDLKVFDRWFDSHDKESLTKLITLAAHNISAGEYLKAHRLMESYWPRFLQEYNTVETGKPETVSRSTRRKIEKQ